MGEIKGLALFRDRFAAHSDKYILIGGCAMHAVLSGTDLKPRATKDLDIVLVVEAIDPSFVALFWAFVEEGGYRLSQVSRGDRRKFYRFQKPTNAAFPAMLELFSREPTLSVPLGTGTHLTPIPVGEDVASLSAILLDPDYYAFILAERKDLMGLPYIGEGCLIALKAVAWLDLRERKASGDAIDGKDIGKHLMDVFALSQVLLPSTRFDVSPRIAADIERFAAEARMEQHDLSRFGKDISADDIILGIQAAFCAASPEVRAVSPD